MNVNRAAKALGSSASRQINAVVVSSGLMQKTVKVRVGIQEWNRHIGKNFAKSRSLLVHDPSSSLRTGDIVSISPGFRASKNVRHVVNAILAPFGEPIESRPPIPSEEERIEKVVGKRAAKEERRSERARLAEEGAESVGEGVVDGGRGGKGGQGGKGAGASEGSSGRQEKQRKVKKSGRQTATLGSAPTRSAKLQAA